MDINHHQKTQTLSLLATPLARFLFSFIFISSGFNHFSSGSISYAESMGVPLSGILVPVSGVLAIIGGLSVLLGLHAKAGSIVLLIFLVPVTLIMHPFWSITNPEEAQIQFIHFLKNLSLMGSCFLIFILGSGPASLDQQRKTLTDRLA